MRFVLIDNNPDVKDRGFKEYYMITYLKFAKRVIIFIIGITVLLIGFITLVTPGPAFIIIPAGLGILATEFVWAQRWLKRVKKEIDEGGPTLRSWKEHVFYWWNKRKDSSG